MTEIIGDTEIIQCCNICNGTDFKDYGGRKNAMCARCFSMERHRSMRYALECLNLLKKQKSPECRILHLAPEQCTSIYLNTVFGTSYIAADKNPELYPNTKCLKFTFPDDYSIFPKDYFDIIIHNHVLEHIPGSYVHHIAIFHKLLKRCGKMLFTLPTYSDKKTTEGGEYCVNDQERLNRFGQSDHFKIFGNDFEEIFECFRCNFTKIAPPAEISKKFNARGIVYCYEKL